MFQQILMWRYLHKYFFTKFRICTISKVFKGLIGLWGGNILLLLTRTIIIQGSGMVILGSVSNLCMCFKTV